MTVEVTKIKCLLASCPVEFAPTKPDHKFCGLPCKNAFHGQRRKEAMKLLGSLVGGGVTYVSTGVTT